MISRLPPELLGQIINCSIPPTFHSETYRLRQSTLCSLSLVSKGFLQIAQPLLLEIVWVEFPCELTEVLDVIEAKQWTRQMRHVIVADKKGYALKPGLLGRLGRAGQGIKILTLFLKHDKPLKCSPLKFFPNLEILRLGGARFDFKSPVVLSKVEELSINADALGPVAPLLDRKFLPSLRTLGMPSVKDEEDSENLDNSQLLQLVPQIESILVDIDLIDFLPDCLAGALDRTLFDFYLPSSNYFANWQPFIQHLRIRAVDPSMTVEYANVLYIFARIIDRSRLRSLYLDLEWEHPTTPPGAISEAIDGLKQACRKKGIEIVYEKQEPFRINSWICKEFSERQRKIRM